MIRGTPLAAALVAGLLFAARPAAASGVTDIDPCRLVTKPEAQAVLGAAVASEVSPPARVNRSSVRICSIRGTNGRILTIFISSQTKAAFDHEKAGLTPVAGIGDDAYANPPGIVAVRRGETVVTLSMDIIGGAVDAGLLEKVKTLARAATGRL